MYSIKLAIVAGVVLFCNTVVAQASVVDTLVVTSTRDLQPIKNLAGNTSVIDRQDLDIVAHQHIQESLVRIPGVNVARGNGLEYLPALRSAVLTGAGACGSVLTAVDGIPLRAAGFCNINELFEAPTEQAARIEVVRGPGSAFYGSNAMNGVLNVITAAVNNEDIVTIGLDAGPNDYSRIKISASNNKGKHGLRSDLMLSHDGGYRDDSGYDQQKLTLRHEYIDEKLAVTNRLLLSNLNQETAGYITGKNAYKNTSLKKSNPNPEAYRDAQSFRMSSEIDYTIDQQHQLLITPYFRYTEMEFLQHFLPGQPVEKNGHSSIGIQGTYFQDFTDNFRFVSGIDIEYTDGFLKQSQESPTSGSAFLQATIPQGKHYDYAVDALMTAVFFQSSWDLNASWSVNFGLRWEAMDYDYDNKMLAGRTTDNGSVCGFGGCRYTRPADSHDSYENWSPKLGFLYHINESNQAYVNVSRGFRAPQATELYRLQREQEIAQLDSEELDSFELGLRGVQQKLTYEIVYYTYIQRNIIFRDSDFFNVANGKSHSNGVELAVGYDLLDTLKIAATVNYADHQYRDNRLIGGVDIDGNQLDSSPKVFGSMQVLWAFRPDARVELEWLHQGDYYTDPENQHSYKGHDIINFRSSWSINKSLTVSTRLTNLTDRDYAERADYSGFSGDRYFPGEPRSLYLGMSLRF